MRVVTLYIGSKQPRARSEIVRLLSAEFSSFTIIDGEGFFRGSPEPCWMVKIATADSAQVIRVAAQIREALDQDGVGIEFDGRYYRCTDQDCASDLAKFLDVTAE